MRDVQLSYKMIRAIYRELGLQDPKKFAQKTIKRFFKKPLRDSYCESADILTRQTGKTTYDICCALAKHKITGQPIMIRANHTIRNGCEERMKKYAEKLGLQPEITTTSPNNESSMRGFSGIVYTDHTARMI